MPLGVTALSQVAANTVETQADIHERVRLCFPWPGRGFGAAANICEHLRMDADPPCKRAVVSSILTGGSTLPTLFTLVNGILAPNMRATEHPVSTN